MFQRSIPGQHLPEAFKSNRCVDQDPGPRRHPYSIVVTEQLPNDRKVKGSTKWLKSIQKTRQKVHAPPVTNSARLIRGNSWWQPRVDDTGEYGGKSCLLNAL